MIMEMFEFKTYSSPACNMFIVTGSSLLCDSPSFGNENEAGSEMEEDDDNTYNY